MFILNGYKSHFSIQFKDFYKEKNIITFCLFIYSLYIIQSLDIGCFNVLKRLYGRELEVFIKVYINYITKTEFFIVFKAVYFNIIISNNIQEGFRGAGLMLYNPQVVLLKFDIKLQTLIPIELPFLQTDLQVSQIPYNFNEVVSQLEHV